MPDIDLAILGVKLFRQGRWNKFDIGISQGRFSKISPAGQEKIKARKKLDFSDSFASPGWVDLHTHLLPLRYGGVGTHAEKIGLASGVTALLDVGTVGAANFERLYEKVVKKSATPVYSLLNIKKSGIRFWKVGRAEAPDDDIDLTAEVAARYPDVIKGIKITASREHMLASDPVYYMRRAREAGDRLGLPVMVHIGMTPPSLSDLLPLMKSGDVLTHCFRNGPHTILDRAGKIRDDVLDAKARGVRFDTGHGIRSFSFPVAEKAIEQGFDDFTISSDLYMLSTPFRAKSFAHVLSKFLAIGMKLEDIMDRCSTRAASFLGIEREISEGKPAAMTVFRVEKGSFTFKDCWGIASTGTQRIVPAASILDGRLYQAKT